jgi:hypothetical protein
MRRYERASTLLTSNRPVDDWGKLLGDSAAVTAMLDRLLHHGHVLNVEMDYDRYTLLVQSSAPQQEFKLEVRSSEGLRLKRIKGNHQNAPN